MNVILDSCFWYGVYTPDDQHHKEASEIAKLLFDSRHTVLIPYPSMYEFINTVFAKNTAAMDELRWIMTNPKICVLLPDEQYRADAERIVFDNTRNLSLVDVVIRLMLEDENIKSEAIITFNAKDFEDVCRRQQKLLIDSKEMMACCGK